MKLSYRRRPTVDERRELGLPESTNVTAVPGDPGSVVDSVDLTPGTVTKLVGLLSGSTGLGTLLVSALVLSCERFPDSSARRALQDRCAQLELLASALRSEKPEERLAAMQLLIAAGVLVDADSGLTRVAKDTSLLLPHWPTPPSLPICTELVGARASASGAREAGDGVQSSGDAADSSTTSSGRRPESSATTIQPR
jgi:hypothetical protein